MQKKAHMHPVLHIMLRAFSFASILFPQVEIADGYTSILESNRFDGAPHYPLVTAEIRAGFDLDKEYNPN